MNDLSGTAPTWWTPLLGFLASAALAALAAVQIAQADGSAARTWAFAACLVVFASIGVTNLAVAARAYATQRSHSRASAAATAKRRKAHPEVDL